MISPKRWRPAAGLTLEPNADYAARETARSLALMAGPGAGKTEMLAQRADFLLRTGACQYPWRILAISFKVDASRNLRLRVLERCGHQLASRLDSHTFHAFANQLIGRFRPVLTGDDALDADYTVGSPRVHRQRIEFGDMVPLAVQILKDSPVARNTVRHTYSHVFLDEFQDCTGQQYELIRTAFLGSGAVLTAVGDTKQRIMVYAGALEGIFESFACDFQAETRVLYHNFRSLPRLRRMQNAMVKVMEPRAAVEDSKIAGPGGKVRILRVANDSAEAVSVAKLIEGLISKQGLPASEIAVLVPHWVEQYARLLMAELDARGIPYRNEQAMQDLSAEPIARLIVDYLAVLYGDREPDAYCRLMDVLRMTAYDEESDYETQATWHDFIASERGRVCASPPTVESCRQIVDQFLDRLPPEFLTELSSDYERDGRIKELVDKTLIKIAEMLDVSRDLAPALARFDEDSAVRIMTIHKSKGLEFDTVVMLGVEKETYWVRGPEDVDEKRRVYFVGISRAKRRLLLTVTRHRPRPPGHEKRWTVIRTAHEEFLGYATNTE